MEVISPSLAGAVVIKPAGKDSRWLTLEVCREFARANCPRSAEECKYAHPPPHVEIQNGRVTCCYDSIKGKCQRNTPPCKYLHPPSHLQEQLLQTGKQNLAMKNIQAAQAVAVAGLQPMLQMASSNQPGVYPILYSDALKLQSAYPTMVFPSQYPYMPMNQHMAIGGNVAAASAAALSPYQLYTPAPTANPYFQLIDHLNGTTHQQALQSAVSMPLSVVNNTQHYSMASNNQLQMWNAVNSAYGYGNALPQTNLQDDLTITSEMNAVNQSPAKYYKDVPMAAVQQSVSSSTVVNVYQQPPPTLSAGTTGAEQLQTANVGRKRPLNAPDEMLMGMHGVGAAGIKRPALVDNKTGLPVYQPMPASGNPYQQYVSLQGPQPRFVTLGAVNGCPTVIPPF